MKIPTNHPQFSDGAALLIVTGKQSAEFFILNQGTAERVDQFEIPKTKYSDNEGKSIRVGRGTSMVSGGSREPDKQQITVEFLRELKKRIRPLLTANEVRSTYLYAPDHLMPHLKEALSATIKKTYAMSFLGNYLGYKPLELIEMIQIRQVRRADKRRVQPSKTEATKLLRKIS